MQMHGGHRGGERSVAPGAREVGHLTARALDGYPVALAREERCGVVAADVDSQVATQATATRSAVTLGEELPQRGGERAEPLARGGAHAHPGRGRAIAGAAGGRSGIRNRVTSWY
jgi:hypothetical protein